MSQEDPASLKGHSDRSKSAAKCVFEVMYTDALETLWANATNLPLVNLGGLSPRLVTYP